MTTQRCHLEGYPYRMEYGTPNLPGIAGLNAGVEWVDRIGLGAIHAHEMALWRALRDGLSAIEGSHSAARSPAKGSASVFSPSTSTGSRP
jgi:selenocysteine lyase/cysteine desulfurase